MYSIQALNSVSDCDTLIANATSDKNNLEFRRTSILHRQTSSSTNSAEVEGQILHTNLLLDAVNQQIAILPEGDEKEKALVEQAQLIYRQRTLLQRRKTTGPLAIINLESDLADVDHQIAERDTLIAAVTARKNEITG